MKKQILFIAVIAFSITAIIYFGCKRSGKHGLLRNLDNPNYVFSAADVVDSDYVKTYDQMDYLAMGLAIVGNNPQVAHNVSFKTDLIKQSYEGSSPNSPWKDEMPTKDLQTALNDTNFLTDSTFLDAIMSHATTYSPLPNGAPINPYQTGFENEFTTRENSTSIGVSHYTFLTIPFSPDIYSGWNGSWTYLPMVVIPGKDFESDSIGGIPNPYLPIKGYIYTNKIDTITFADEFAIKAQQGVNYLIVVINFDKKDPPAGTSDGDCDAHKSCGDEFCSYGCGEDSSNCHTGECAGRYHLNLDNVTLEKDIRYSCSGATFEPLHENWARGKYEINFQVFIYHCNGSTEAWTPQRFANWKRRELEKEHQGCNGQVTSTATGTKTTKSKTFRLSDMFKPWGGAKSDRIYIMFYEDDPRRTKNIAFTATNNGHTILSHMQFNTCPKESPYGYKTPWSKDGDVEPVPNQGWNHIMEIKGSDFTPTGANSGIYTYIDPPGVRGIKYGLSFSMAYTKDH